MRSLLLDRRRRARRSASSSCSHALGIVGVVVVALVGWIIPANNIIHRQDSVTVLSKQEANETETKSARGNASSAATTKHYPLAALPFQGFSNTSERKARQWAKHNCHVLPNICHDGQALVRLLFVSNETSANYPTWVIHRPAPSSSSSRQNGGKTSQKLKAVTSPDPKCVASNPIPTHVVLYGDYSWYLMEFYLRIVSQWWTILDDEGFHDDFANPDNVQFYNADSRVTPTQHILMQAFSNHLFTTMDNAFWNHSSNSSASNHHSCPQYECFSKFLLCGYRRSEYTVANQKIVQFQPTDMKSRYVLQRPFQDLKTFIRRRVLGDDARQDQMAQLKRDLIQAKTTKSKQQVQNLDDWTIVGFSQRTNRRRWINLPRILQYCHDTWLDKRILCVPVNMDDTDMQQFPAKQAVLHGVLDGLIGIHGSQQAHAVWMKPHSFVLELLPYVIPGERWGEWTQYTDQCTINGYMTKHTDLHHVGHPMGMESLPNCSEYDESRACNDSVEWDNRDFVVNWTDIELFLQRFAVPPRPTTCSQFEQLSQADEFVLYNVHCTTDNGTTWQSKEFFRPRSSFPHLNRNNGLQYGPTFAKCLLEGSNKGDSLTDRIATCNHTYKDLVPDRSTLLV